jgi:hypothetical protein
MNHRNRASSQSWTDLCHHSREGFRNRTSPPDKRPIFPSIALLEPHRPLCSPAKRLARSTLSQEKGLTGVEEARLVDCVALVRAVTAVANDTRLIITT